MRANLARAVTTAELVRVSGVPERTLHKHFRAFVGCSPLAYSRRLRLAAAREELLAARVGSSVTEIAVRYGFGHLGRFSEQYRQSFREAPSSTMRRGRLNSDRQNEQDGGETAAGGNSSRDTPGRTPREMPSLTILPFDTSSSNPEHRFLAESLAEAMACALCRVRSLSVKTPRPLSNKTFLNTQRIARELGARYCVVGRITQIGESVRVIVRLLDATTGNHLWGDSYDGRIVEFFGLQDRVVEGVMRSILPNVRRSEIERARRKRPEDLGAYDLTMRAFPFAFALSPEYARRALDLLRHAMEIEPDYALATAMAAWCHAQLVTYNGTRSIADEKLYAVRLAERAGILDSDDPLVLTARCAVHTMVNELEIGAALLERALALDPASSWSWVRSGWLKTYLGESDTAIEHFDRAVGLDARSAQNANRLAGVGSAHFDAGRYEQAARWMQAALLEQPGTIWVNRTLAVSYARLGDRLAALDAVDALRRYCPDLTVGEVMKSIPFTQDCLDRIANGLSDLGLPP
jgi:adenylate cyclase